MKATDNEVLVATGVGRFGPATEYQSVLLFSFSFHDRDME